MGSSTDVDGSEEPYFLKKIVGFFFEKKLNAAVECQIDMILYIYPVSVLIFLSCVALTLAKPGYKPYQNWGAQWHTIPRNPWSKVDTQNVPPAWDIRTVNGSNFASHVLNQQAPNVYGHVMT